MSNDETMWREVLVRLAKIEENTKGLDEVTKKAQEAYSMACGNSEDIKELKEAQKINRNWLMTIVAGIVGYLFTNYFLR